MGLSIRGSNLILCYDKTHKISLYDACADLFHENSKDWRSLDLASLYIIHPTSMISVAAKTRYALIFNMKENSLTSVIHDLVNPSTPIVNLEDKYIVRLFNRTWSLSNSIKSLSWQLTTSEKEDMTRIMKSDSSWLPSFGSAVYEHIEYACNKLNWRIRESIHENIIFVCDETNEESFLHQKELVQIFATFMFETHKCKVTVTSLKAFYDVMIKGPHVSRPVLEKSLTPIKWNDRDWHRSITSCYFGFDWEVKDLKPIDESFLQ